MHRHGYVGRKLGRQRDERRRLIMNLATSLILDEGVTTTRPKAKELVPYAERLITKAKKGDLHNRRQVIAGLLRDDAASKLVDELAPQINRSSGFVRLKAAGFRRGDHAPLARVSFVDEFKATEPNKQTKKPAQSSVKKAAKAKTGQKGARPNQPDKAAKKATVSQRKIIKRTERQK